MSKGAMVFGMLIWCGIIIIINYVLIASFNPIDIFYSNVSILAKIVVAIMLAILALNFINFLSVISINQICPICEKDIVKFMGAYGRPKTCWNCMRMGRKTLYHTKCFLAKGKCPVCEKDNPYTPFGGINENL